MRDEVGLSMECFRYATSLMYARHTIGGRHYSIYAIGHTESGQFALNLVSRLLTAADRRVIT